MILKNFKKLKNGKYILNDDKTLMVNDETILKFELLTKKKIDDLNEVFEYDRAIDLYNLIIKKNIKHMLSLKEVNSIINNSSVSDKYKKVILDKIVKLDIINDDKYALSYIHDAVNLKNIGPRRIELDLLNIGVSSNIIKKYLDEIEYDVWKNKINKLIAKKIKSNHTKNGLSLKVAIANYIVHEGYSKDMVMQEVNKYNFFSNDILKKDFNKIKKSLERKYSGEELDNKIKIKLLSKGYNYNDIEETLK